MNSPQKNEPGKMISKATKIIALYLIVLLLGALSSGTHTKEVIDMIVPSIITFFIIISIFRKIQGKQINGQKIFETTATPTFPANFLTLPFHKLKTDPSLQEKVLTKNPRRRKRILKALEEVQEIRKIKTLNNNTLEIEAILADKSPHKYRAAISEEEGEKRLSEFNRFT